LCERHDVARSGRATGSLGFRSPPGRHGEHPGPAIPVQAESERFRLSSRSETSPTGDRNWDRWQRCLSPGTPGPGCGVLARCAARQCHLPRSRPEAPPVRTSRPSHWGP